MWPAIISALRTMATASTGYFVNDVATWINGKVPASVQQKTEGGKAWWFILALLFLMGALIFLLFKFLMPRGKKKGGSLFAWIFGAGVTYLAYFVGGADGMVMATALVTLTTGAAVVTTTNLSFLPERIAFAAATQLSGVKVSVQGDGVVFDSDANGLTHVGLNRVIGQVTNNYVLTLSNCLIPGKNVLFEFTNSAAQTPTVYYDSDSKPIEGQPSLFLQMAKVPILVGGNDFTDFATLSLPSLSATDSITILYNDGTVQANMNRIDLQYRLGYTQNVVNTPIYQIDNYNRMIKAVTVTAGVAQTGYMQRWTASLKNSMVRGEV